MAMTNMCRKCFKMYVDPEVADCHLMEGIMDVKCDGCGIVQKTIIAHFKWGEHRVDETGRDFVVKTKHIGIDLNAPLWKCDVEVPENESKIDSITG